MPESKRPRGRPTKLTPELIEQARKWLPLVLYLETLAELVGVTRQSIYGWLARGKQEAKRLEKGGEPQPVEALYLDFFDTVKRAIAKGQFADLATVRAALKTHWQAAAWRLERRFPERWGNQKREIAELQRNLADLERRIGGTNKA